MSSDWWTQISQTNFGGWGGASVLGHPAAVPQISIENVNVLTLASRQEPDRRFDSRSPIANDLEAEVFPKRGLTCH